MLSTDYNEMKFATLIKNPIGTWTVVMKDIRNGAVLLEKKDMSVDAASEFMITQGVVDEEIDYAIKSMFSNDHNRSVFGIMGTFIYSEFKGLLN